MARIQKNSRSYDSGDVSISMLGIMDIYATKISYAVKQDHKANYGLSREPRSWSKGKKEYSASIELMMEDVVAIQTALPEGKSLLDIAPFPIVINFNPNLDGDALVPPVIDKIIAKFQDSGREVDGETGLKKSYELFVLEIVENIKSI